MWFLRAISPHSVPKRKVDWTLRVKMYCWLLNQLKWKYAHGAISDMINIDSVKIIHDVRDHWFERELRRFGIDIDQHLKSHKLNINLDLKCHRSRIFNWTESLKVLYEGKTYSINRTSKLVIETNMDGVLKVSTIKDLLFRSEFTARNGNTEEEWQYDDNIQQSSSYPNPDIPSKNRVKRKITVKDSIISKNTESQKEIHTTIHQGFEENDVF